MHPYIIIHTKCISSNFFTHNDNWSSQLRGVDIPPFVEPVGPAIQLPPTVLGVFRLFFTTSLVATIIEQTNLYARQVLGDEADNKWADVTSEDI